MPAAHRIFMGKFKIAYLNIGGVCPEIGNLETFRGDSRHVVIVEINHLFGMSDDGVRIAGEEIFVLADADDQGRTTPGADNGIREIQCKLPPARKCR